MHQPSLKASPASNRLFAAVRSVGGALVLAAALSRGAVAQSSMTAQCVGGSIGCNQINFTLTAMGSLPASIDFFRIAITGSDFRFSSGQPGSANDPFDITFFTPTVSSGGTVLTGTFGPGFEPVMDPFVRILAQFQPNTHTDASSLFFTYQAGVNGQITFQGAVTAAPEPGSLVLLGTGLLALGGIVVRGRRTA